MRASIVRAQRQTNPDVVKVAIIAHTDEWNELINYLKDDEEEDSVIKGFIKILDDTVNNGLRESYQRTDIETREDSG